MSGSYEQIAATIRERRTIRDFNGQPLDKELVMDLLEQANWAPFHSAKEPWRFILFMDEGRTRFADAMIATLTPKVLDKWGEWFRDQYCRLAQAHLLVVIQKDDRPKYWEDSYGAAAAFIQNLQLLAWERQVGIVWKTNEYNWDSGFKAAVGVGEDEHIIGTLHMGRFDKKPRQTRRTAIEKLITYIDE